MMRTTTILAVLGMFLLAAAAEAGVEEGAATVTPWSGYWWPKRKGELLGPLAKYDQLTGHTAAVWERRHSPPGPKQQDWEGYCHAWSAAAITEEEPKEAKTIENVSVGVADQKGWLTAAHTQDVANFAGHRYDGRPGDDLQDIYPDVLWNTLKSYIGQRRPPDRDRSRPGRRGVELSGLQVLGSNGSRRATATSRWVRSTSGPPTTTSTRASSD